MELEAGHAADDHVRKSQSLRTLNGLSSTRTFQLEDINWDLPLDRTRPWVPEELISISYLPSYSLLRPEQKLKYNQQYALAICEQFIWFEKDLVSRFLQSLLQQKSVTPDLRDCLHAFINEEQRHSEMFRRVLLKAEPEVYRHSCRRYVAPGIALSALIQSAIRWPDHLLAWIWLSIYFEERTLHISRLYRQAEKHGQAIDPTFCHVHALHMIDEARHLQIDQHLLSAFYDSQPMWKKSLAALVLKKVLRAYRCPRRVALRVMHDLKKQEMDADHVWSQLENELPSLAVNRKFADVMFGADAMGRTRALLKHYPEMKSCYSAFVK